MPAIDQYSRQNMQIVQQFFIDRLYLRLTNLSLIKKQRGVEIAGQLSTFQLNFQYPCLARRDGSDPLQ